MMQISMEVTEMLNGKMPDSAVEALRGFAVEAKLASMDDLYGAFTLWEVAQSAFVRRFSADKWRRASLDSMNGLTIWGKSSNQVLCFEAHFDWPDSRDEVILQLQVLESESDSGSERVALNFQFLFGQDETILQVCETDPAGFWQGVYSQFMKLLRLIPNGREVFKSSTGLAGTTAYDEIVARF